MACLVAPLAEAVAVLVVKKVVEKKEKREGFSHRELTRSKKLGWLNNLLWGGVLLLTVEHLWSGEIVPWPPFLTAMYNPADIQPMFHEIFTIGLAMSVLVTMVWAIMVVVADLKIKAQDRKGKLCS